MTPRDPLHDQARDLPREIEPPRDLWPDIAARLDAVEREPAAGAGEAPDTGADDASPELRTWRERLGLPPAAAAAVLVAATVTVALLAGPDRIGAPSPQLPGGGGPSLRADAGTLSTLEDGYADVRADLVTVLDTRCDQWPGGACEGLRTGLSELDQSAQELRAALRQAPPGSEAARQLTVRYQRTLEQARGLAGHAARL